MELSERQSMEKQLATIQAAVLDLQKDLDLDIANPGGPVAVRSCTSCLSNSCNQPAAIASK